MNILIIALSVFSTLIVAVAIITEGRLKREEIDESVWKTFKSELSKVAALGWFLIVISFVGNLLNACLTIINTNDSNNQLLELKSNGESIKLAVIDNAAKAMEEQRISIEKERENTFIHLQNEVEDNLQKILMNYERQHILGFGDTTTFMSTRLANYYIKKYESISKQKYVIGFLTEASEAIDKVNYYADQVLQKTSKSVEKKADIRMFLKNVEFAKDYLYPIYNRVVSLQSYKEYESINFSVSIPPVNRDTLNKYIYQSVLNRPDVEFEPPKK